MGSMLYITVWSVRLATVLSVGLAIGADSMGAIAPTAKEPWGRYPQVAPTGIVMSVFETV